MKKSLEQDYNQQKKTLSAVPYSKTYNQKTVE